MTDGDAFYLPLGDNRYEPTRATESPWDRDAQHGGPPAALLAHLIDANRRGAAACPCHMRLADDGIGIAHADLHDERGFLGEVAQPLLISRR